LCRLESWQFGAARYIPLVGRAAWLWCDSLESADMHLALCFGAFKRLLAEKQTQRETALNKELSTLNGEALTLRQGSFVCRGPEALMYLALKWNRKDLSGISEGCGSPDEARIAEEVLKYIEWLEELHKLLLHGLVFPQLLFPSHVEEMDVYEAVHKARAEAEAMLLHLENDLSTKMRTKRLCGDRLTIVDFCAAAILKVAELIGQDWYRYPNIAQYVDSLDLLPGYADAFQRLQIVIDESRHGIRASGSTMILV